MDTTTSSTWHIVMEFVGIDLDDDDVLEALAPTDDLDVLWSSVDGLTTADATVQACSLQEAIGDLLSMALSGASDSEIVRLVDPLVSVSDIAEEAGVSRQAARNWALGTRHSGFPAAVATVGDGIRVWRLADVDRWLTEVLAIGSGREHPTAYQVAGFNEHGLDAVGKSQPKGSENSRTISTSTTVNPASDT